MKGIGIIVCLLGWLIAVLSLKVPGVYPQMFVAASGFIVAIFGALGILSPAHNKNAIWKA